MPKDWTPNQELPDTPTVVFGYFEHVIILDIISATLFRNAEDLGVKFRSWFDPINKETIAFFLTTVSNRQSPGLVLTLTETLSQIDFCLGEWSTGIHVPARLNATTDSGRYEDYLSDLKLFEEENPRRYGKTVRALHRYAR